MSDTLRTSLAFAGRGIASVALWWPVPDPKTGRLICACKRGADCPSPAKHPHGPTAPHGLLSATADCGILKHWFSSRAPEANLGIVVPPGIVVLDFDPKHGGELADFEAGGRELPPSWRAQTGSLGWHCYFRIPDGVEIRGETYNPQAANNGQTFAGVDILVRGGYVVAPPSRHVSGRSYAWDVDHHPADVPLAELPGWLIEKLAAKDRAHGNGRTDAEWQNILTGPVATEYRDNAACAVAGLALARISDVTTAWHFLRTWNALAVQPPLPERDLWTIFDRIAERERKKSTWQ